MDHLNSTQCNLMKSTDELNPEELRYAIVTEVERLETDNFNNSAVLCDSTVSNDCKYDGIYLTEMVMKPDFPTDIDAVHSNKTSSNCYNYLPKTGETRVGNNFVKEICNEIVPTRNECEIQIDSTVPRFQFVIIVNQMQRMHEMVINLQMDNVALQSQVKQQHERILELENQLVGVTANHHQSFQTLMYDKLKIHMTQESAELSVPHSYSPRIEIGYGQTRTNFSIESVKLSTEDVMRTETHCDSLPRFEHRSQSREEGNFNQSENSLGIKQVGRGDGKRSTINKECIGESPKNAQNSRSNRHFCEECKKLFKRKNTLTQHLRIHSGERPYLCDICKKSYRYKKNLSTHTRIHQRCEISRMQQVPEEIPPKIYLDEASPCAFLQPTINTCEKIACQK